MKNLTRRGKIIAGSAAGLILIALAWWLLFPPNPLIGKWVAIDKDSDPFRVSVTLLGRVEFRPDAMIQFNGSFPARYEVSRWGKEVKAYVQTSTGGISEEAYTIKRTPMGLRMLRPVPFMPDGTVEYRREE